MFSLAKNLANTDPKKGIIFVVVVVLDGIKWESQPRIVSGSNDNDLLLVCYYARAPCFRLFAFWLFIFISPASFFHVFLSALLLLVFNCYTTATLFWLYIPRRSRFFFIGVVVGLLYNIVHTPKYYRGLVCVCICRTRADSLCCVRDDDQGRCSDTDRNMSPHSTFLFSLCHLLFYFLFLLLLPFFPLSGIYVGGI